MPRSLRSLVRPAALAIALGLAGCHPHAYHPYTASGPQGDADQAYWRDFSHKQEQLATWRAETERDRAARQARDLRMITR